MPVLAFTSTLAAFAKLAAVILTDRIPEGVAEIAGLDAVSLQPAAGSQGELTGLMLVRAYFADRGELDERRKVVVPDTAHGTNPASVTMAGFELQPVKTDARGNLDLEDLRRLDPDDIFFEALETCLKYAGSPVNLDPCLGKSWPSLLQKSGVSVVNE